MFLQEGWSFVIRVCKSLRSLYLVNQLQTMVEFFKEFAQQQIEGCSGIVSYEDFTLNNSLLRCLLDRFWHRFQGRYLANIFNTSCMPDLLLVSIAVPNALSDTSTGSNRCSETKGVWLVRLSQHFASITKSRYILLLTSMIDDTKVTN